MLYNADGGNQLPCLRAATKVAILGTVAEVCTHQTYINRDTTPVHIVCQVLLDEQAVLCNFEVVKDGRIMLAQVVELSKEQLSNTPSAQPTKAKQTPKKQKSSAASGLSGTTQNLYGGDNVRNSLLRQPNSRVMQADLGELGAGQDLRLSLRYLTELRSFPALCGNTTTLEFTLPWQYFPRHNAPSQSESHSSLFTYTHALGHNTSSFVLGGWLPWLCSRVWSPSHPELDISRSPRNAQKGERIALSIPLQSSKRDTSHRSTENRTVAPPTPSESNPNGTIQKESRRGSSDISSEEEEAEEGVAEGIPLEIKTTGLERDLILCITLAELQVPSPAEHALPLSLTAERFSPLDERLYSLASGANAMALPSFASQLEQLPSLSPAWYSLEDCIALSVRLTLPFPADCSRRHGPEEVLLIVPDSAEWQEPLLWAVKCLPAAVRINIVAYTPSAEHNTTLKWLSAPSTAPSRRELQLFLSEGATASLPSTAALLRALANVLTALPPVSRGGARCLLAFCSHPHAPSAPEELSPLTDEVRSLLCGSPHRATTPLFVVCQAPSNAAAEDSVSTLEQLCAHSGGSLEQVPQGPAMGLEGALSATLCGRLLAATKWRDIRVQWRVSDSGGVVPLFLPAAVSRGLAAGEVVSLYGLLTLSAPKDDLPSAAAVDVDVHATLIGADGTADAEYAWQRSLPLASALCGCMLLPMAAAAAAPHLIRRERTARTKGLPFDVYGGPAVRGCDSGPQLVLADIVDHTAAGSGARKKRPLSLAPLEGTVLEGFLPPSYFGEGPEPSEGSISVEAKRRLAHYLHRIGPDAIDRISEVLGDIIPAVKTASGDYLEVDVDMLDDYVLRWIAAVTVDSLGRAEVSYVNYREDLMESGWALGPPRKRRRRTASAGDIASPRNLEGDFARSGDEPPPLMVPRDDICPGVAVPPSLPATPQWEDPTVNTTAEQTATAHSCNIPAAHSDATQVPLDTPVDTAAATTEPQTTVTTQLPSATSAAVPHQAGVESEQHMQEERETRQSEQERAEEHERREDTVTERARQQEEEAEDEEDSEGEEEDKPQQQPLDEAPLHNTSMEEPSTTIKEIADLDVADMEDIDNEPDQGRSDDVQFMDVEADKEVKVEGIAHKGREADPTPHKVRTPRKRATVSSSSVGSPSYFSSSSAEVDEVVTVAMGRERRQKKHRSQLSPEASVIAVPKTPLSKPVEYGEAHLLAICRRVLVQVMRHHQAWPFLEPVDPVLLEIPDYFDIIKNPMDFGTILKRIDTAYYSSPAAASSLSRSTPELFDDDMQLVFSNAWLYNPEGTPVNRMTTQVHKVYEKSFVAALTKEKDRLEKLLHKQKKPVGPAATKELQIIKRLIARRPAAGTTTPTAPEARGRGSGRGRGRSVSPSSVAEQSSPTQVREPPPRQHDRRGRADSELHAELMLLESPNKHQRWDVQAHPTSNAPLPPPRLVPVLVARRMQFLQLSAQAVARLRGLVGLQEPSGAWMASTELADVLGVGLELLSHRPDVLDQAYQQSTEGDAWTTALVLCTLERHYVEARFLLQPIEEKAVCWLKGYFTQSIDTSQNPEERIGHLMARARAAVANATMNSSHE